MNFFQSSTNPSSRSHVIDNKAPLGLLKTIALLFLIIGVVFFVVSLFLTVFFTNGDDIRGVWVFVTGWLGFVIFQFAWFANPLSLLALLVSKKRPFIALMLCIAAVIVASNTFFFNEIPSVSGNDKIYIKEFGLGAYFWYASHWLFLYSIIVKVIIRGINANWNSTPASIMISN